MSHDRICPIEFIQQGYQERVAQHEVLVWYREYRVQWIEMKGLQGCELHAEDSISEYTLIKDRVSPYSLCLEVQPITEITRAAVLSLLVEFPDTALLNLYLHLRNELQFIRAKQTLSDKELANDSQ